MSDDGDPGISARRVHADEWQLVRSLRLESTADPDAAIAFLESHEEVLARADDFWQARTADAAQSETVAQLIAEVGGGAVGSLSVRIRANGQKDPLGRYIDDRRADVVGVWVRPSSRGTGAIDALLAAAAEFVTAVGLRTHAGWTCIATTSEPRPPTVGPVRAHGETFAGPIGPRSSWLATCPESGRTR
jgi:GNAT superfamily N-acetyltransferase